MYIQWCREYHKTIEKVWDLKSQRLFWYNHHTKESSWEKPRLVRRFGDVEKPFTWITLSIDSPDGATDESGAPLQVPAYWHVVAKKQMNRKPDGVFLCSSCQYNISVRRCFECKANYCFACFRSTHSSPFGFHQRVDVESIIADQALLGNYSRMDHDYKKVEPKQCSMCKTEKIMAAFSCAKCDIAAMCRPCSRRLHAHGSYQDHLLQELTEWSSQ